MWFLVEIAVAAVIILTFVTQILIPIVCNLPMFPIFRTRKVTNQLADLYGEREGLEMQEYIDSVVEENKKRSQKNDDETVR